MPNLFNRIFRKKDQVTAVENTVVKHFRRRYASFRRLLEANASLADIMAELEEKREGKSLFGFNYLRKISQKAIKYARTMAKALQNMEPGKHAGLNTRIEEIETALSEILGQSLKERSDHPPGHAVTLDFIDDSLSEWVGGKAANLGELLTMADVPVPEGFAVTVGAFRAFMEQTHLGETIPKMMADISADDQVQLAAVMEEVQKAIEETELPPEVEEALNAAWEATFQDRDLRVAVRSSAQSEDGEKSFAGQFLSVLGVSKAGLSQSYRKVVASLFTPSATVYRLHQGIPLSASAMGVLVVAMVDPVASGVAFSHDPSALANETLIINGVYGLGALLVDGKANPDAWIYTRDERPQLIRRRRGNQTYKIVLRESTGHSCLAALEENLLPHERDTPCLPPNLVNDLARLVMRLERHFGGYQDVEWVLDKEGQIFIVQSRPLEVHTGFSRPLTTPVASGHTLLLEGGDAAFAGIGFGTVVKPKSMKELSLFPAGGILVARHSSPEYAQIMDRAQAIITETGGVTGHMATLAREFRVPTLLKVPGVFETLAEGMEITLDSYSCRIYEGHVEELRPLQGYQEPIRLLNTPVYSAMRKIAKHILPLNLTDPASAEFTPRGCRTLHDIMRYAHENSYHAMFAFSDSASGAEGVAKKFAVHLPIDLHIIDLDKGTTARPEATRVKLEEITSVPMKALLRGMLDPAVVFRKPRHVNMGGFMSVMSQQIANPVGGDNRFGSKSYAIVSDRYLNFSSRVGYHYSVLDAYCGKTLSKNYVSFSFQGGAAGEDRRIRRVRAIALVLEELGFTVYMQRDTVKARMQKFESEVLEKSLVELGKLLQVTRQMDMLMINDAAITQFRDDFMNGIYR